MSFERVLAILAIAVVIFALTMLGPGSNLSIDLLGILKLHYRRSREAKPKRKPKDNSE